MSQFGREKAQIRCFGDAAFIVGTIIDGSKISTVDPDHEVKIWLPLAEVAEITEFENREAMGGGDGLGGKAETESFVD